MYLVDNIDLIWSLIRLELGTFDHISDIVDSRIRSGIDLDNIEKTSVFEIATVLTLSARIPVSSKGKAVYSFGKYPCNGRLTSSTRTMKKIGSNRTILQKSILQNLSNKSLSEKRMKIFRSICLIQCHLMREIEKVYDAQYMDIGRKTKFKRKFFYYSIAFFKKIIIYRIYCLYFIYFHNEKKSFYCSHYRKYRSLKWRCSWMRK